jgi:hypothetical protein
MATNINEEVSNAYNAAKQALNDDLKQNFYNAAQARMTAFRQINNNANANHALFSGVPAAQQMQYDASKYVPGLGTALVTSLEKQEKNQETWDKYMKYVSGLNAEADKYKKLAGQLNTATGQYGTAIAGLKSIPTGNINKISGGGGNGSSGANFAEGQGSGGGW